MQNKIEKVILLGSGALKIGEAGEFDYSGSQALKALKEEGVYTVLINPNIATIQTSENIADKVYFLPVTPEFVEQVIARERPQGILLAFGGQTALNCGVKLYQSGVLEKYGVQVLGTPVQAIIDTEDREKFVHKLDQIDVKTIKSEAVTTVAEAKRVAHELGYPVIIRAAYTLGGLGSGFCDNDEELDTLASKAFTYSPQILVEKSLKGWKEVEYEVVRDRYDNCITVCNMENFDPVGVHTGDSIVVAPSQTLRDPEHQMLRSASMNIISALGIEGGCNVQYALSPDSMQYYVIEVNPRVSRSSALASKATGYPIAKVTTRIALGYTLDEIVNGVTGQTYACAEPTIDYVVLKFPRWPFDKFVYADKHIGTKMKATGEIMAIGTNFENALLKAVRSLEMGKDSLVTPSLEALTDDELETKLHSIDTERSFVVAEALRRGVTMEHIHEVTKIDIWFLKKVQNIVRMEQKLRAMDGMAALDRDTLMAAKKMGMADSAIARFVGCKTADIRMLRERLKVLPAFRMVDTCGGEFEAVSPYFYSTYGTATEAKNSGRKTVVVLGSGPVRLGQGIEFDYCSVHCVWALKRAGFDTVIINNNPETVSTDFDTADRLYFEPLTPEDVMNVLEIEQPVGVVCQFGGQTAIKLAKTVREAGYSILGTDLGDIDAAEDRELFNELLNRLGIPQPKGTTVFTADEAAKAAAELGYPVLVRPSYVLGGRGMEIVYDDKQLNKYVDRALAEAKADTVVSGRLPSPLLIDKFLQDAIEIDVDALFDGEELYIGGIMEHVEEAGVHSGDAACTLPPSTLSDDQIRRLREGTYAIAKGCHVQGLINVQYAFMANTLYVIEANPRASRTVPFASKATGVALAKAAARIMAGETIADQRANGLLLPKGDGGDIHPGQQVAVKESVLPFKRFRTPVGKTVDILLGPEMRSTGEVMGFDRDFPHAFAKSQLAAYDGGLPTHGNVFISVNDTDKRQLPLFAARLVELGFNIWATEGTASVLRRYGIDSKIVDKISVRMDSDPDDPITTYHAEGSVGKNVVQLIEEGAIDLILNTPNSRGSRSDGYAIRSAAIAADLPQFTTMTEFSAVLMAIEAVRNNDYQIMSIQEHSKQLFELERREF